MATRSNRNPRPAGSPDMSNPLPARPKRLVPTGSRIVIKTLGVSDNIQVFDGDVLKGEVLAVGPGEKKNGILTRCVTKAGSVVFLRNKPIARVDVGSGDLFLFEDGDVLGFVV